jgi:hypothetical protein
MKAITPEAMLIAELRAIRIAIYVLAGAVVALVAVIVGELISL